VAETGTAKADITGATGGQTDQNNSADQNNDQSQNQNQDANQAANQNQTESNADADSTAGNGVLSSASPPKAYS
jgi:hypothetical protein